MLEMVHDSPEDPPLLSNHVNHNNNHSDFSKKNGKERPKVLKPLKFNRPRLVAKDGECLIRPVRLPNQYMIQYRNFFHLVIEQSWRSIIAIFAGGFLVTWLTFGVLYYIIIYLSGDLQKRPENGQCIANVHSFISAFLFSLESQHTIGYGTRYMTEVCPPAFVVLCIQLIIGVFLQTILAGIVVAKVLRPKKRKQEMRFSRTAVVGPLDVEHDDKRPALMIRIADIQHRLYLAESHVRLYMATTRYNSRGEKELVGVRGRCHTKQYTRLCSLHFSISSVLTMFRHECGI
jgi:potassium inwardly-rectifying channel subfamily J